jgi:hypothetical protein
MRNQMTILAVAACCGAVWTGAEEPGFVSLFDG